MSMLGKRPLVSFRTPETQPAGEKDSNGAESSDGWSSDEDEADTFIGDTPVPSTSSGVTNIQTKKECPKWSLSERFALKKGICFHNFPSDECGRKIMRDESAYKVYPGIELTREFDEYTSVFICLRLFNSKMSKTVRIPDIKTKNLVHKRTSKINEAGETEDTEDGIILNPKHARSIHFKKKCLRREEGKKPFETGFKLGSPFSSFVPKGVDPQFVFIAMPMINGTFAYKQAIRSEPFRVFSKRQPKYMPKSKRRRKHKEVYKMNTDIQHAEFTLTGLSREHARLECANTQMCAFFEDIRSMVNNVEDQTLKIALEFALKKDQEEETAIL